MPVVVSVMPRVLDGAAVARRLRGDALRMTVVRHLAWSRKAPMLPGLCHGSSWELTALDQLLREQVAEQVRSEIISGQSGPGAMYSVPLLAASLGVSTTPVREALLELARGGLIEPMRNRGFRVVEPSIDELRNLFDVREVIELHAVRLVARDEIRRRLEGLEIIADEVARAVSAEDVRGYLEADRKFHRALTDAAGNPLLTETVIALRDKMRLYGITSRSGFQRQAASVEEHARLLDLVRAGKGEEAADVLRWHIRSWEPIFAEAIARSVRGTAREPIAR
jgi:DNA-binding GntR family transcriptional regulator